MGRTCAKTSFIDIILVLLIYVVYLTDCQICDKRMTYHEHTETCLVLVKDELRYHAAAGHCKGEYNGGHLVHIYDQETDIFVRGLLMSSKDEALIGLQDHRQNGQYRWTDNLTVPSYFGWKINPHSPSVSYSNTLVTRRGWEEYGNAPARFICQTKPVLTRPRLRCPILEEGRSNPPILCEAWIHTKNQILSASLGRNSTLLANCSLSSCANFNGYQGSLSIDGHRLELTTEIISVLRKDASPLNCTISIGHNLMSFTTCDLKVYVVPIQPKCTHSFNKTHAIINCTTTKAFPEVGCTWTHTFLKGMTMDTVDRKTDAAKILSSSKTSCGLTFPVKADGVYRYSVSMYPSVAGTELKNKSVSTEGEVRIESPTERPQYFITNGVLQDGVMHAAENSTVVITCSVHGGSPLAQDIRIACDEEVKDVTTHRPLSHGDGHIASMKIYVNRHMMNRSCLCSAGHISGTYNQTTQFVISLTNVGHGFSELITVHITTAAGFILIALAAVVITLRLKGFIGRNELDTDVKQEKQQAINEYVGFPLIQPSLLPNVQVGSSPVEDNENNVYQTITDLPGRRPGDYIDMAPMGSSPSILEPDTIIEYLNVPESDPVNYENWQLPCEPRLPETDKESEKDGYVFLRVLRRARNSFRKSLNYQNVKLPWKRSSRVEANQEMQ